VLFLKLQKKEKRQLSAGEKIEMLRCVVTGIEKDHIVMRPMRKDIGIKGDIIYRKKNIKNKDFPNIGDEVVAIGISKEEGKWITELILLKKD